MEIDDKYFIRIENKDYINYEGLLNIGHKNNLKSINVEIVQIPTKDNKMVAICKATATTDKTTFTDIGEASPESVDIINIPHILKIASTRAKASVLKDLSNVDNTIYEGLSSEDKMKLTTNSSIYDNDKPPDIKQIETLKKLGKELGFVDKFDGLTKKTADILILKLIEELSSRSKKK